MRTKTNTLLYLIGFLPLVFVSAGLLVYHNMLITFILYHITICMVLPLIYFKINKETKPDLGLPTKRYLPSVLTGLIIGAFFFAFIVLFFVFFSSETISRQHINELLKSWGLERSQIPLLFIYFVIFNSIVEEIFWRGFFMGELLKHHSEKKAPLMTSFFFVQYHFITVWLLFYFKISLIFTPVIFAASFLWCVLRARFKNIYAAVISHLFADMALVFVLYYYVIKNH